MKTAAEWIALIHKMRQEQSFRPVFDGWESVCVNRIPDGFLFDCLIPLHLSEKCANNFAAILNKHPLKKWNAETAYKVWNAGGHPVRDFLLVLAIDYPEHFKVKEG